MSAAEVRCEMPFSIVDIEIRWSRITWLVSVSNDNVTFSNATKVFVFDSKCLMCNHQDYSCHLKVMAFAIWNIDVSYSCVSEKVHCFDQKIQFSEFFSGIHHSSCKYLPHHNLVFGI